MLLRGMEKDKDYTIEEDGTLIGYYETKDNTLSHIQDIRFDLEERKSVLIEYLSMKLDEGVDWHGIADAANDIREIVAKLDLLKELY